MSSDFWAAVSSLATLVGAVVVSIAAVLAYLQLREMATARSLEAFSRVIDGLTTEEMSKARRYILSNNLPPPDEITPAMYDQMHKLWVAFDNVGIMVAFKMIPERVVLEMFHSTIIRCWQKLEPYILHERRKRKTTYQVYFEDLYHRSIRYRDMHHPEEAKG